MGFWSSIGNVANSVSDGAKWAWNHAPFQQVTTYTKNTGVQLLNQVWALKSAIPALGSPESNKIVAGMYYIVRDDLLPLMAVHYANTQMQLHFREGYEEENAAWYAPYSVFLSVLTLADFGVKIYTFRQGLAIVIHTAVVDAMAPAAFNEYKKKLVRPLPTLCDAKHEHCTNNRFTKGNLVREPLVFGAKYALASTLGEIPVVGIYASRILVTYVVGQYIGSAVTPERCDHHKAMMSELLLALGLSYTLTSGLMGQFFEATIGMPPFIVYRTMLHLLLLLHINVAAHMQIPLVKPENSVFPTDPLTLYEKFIRLCIDILFKGTITVVPEALRPVPGAPELMPLSVIFQNLTNLLNKDKAMTLPEPGVSDKLRKMILPSVLHSTKNATVNDPVIRIFWKDIETSMTTIISYLKTYGKPAGAAAHTTVPMVGTGVKKGLAVALNSMWGISPGLTKWLLTNLGGEEEFWKFLDALGVWLEQRSITEKAPLALSAPVPDLHQIEQKQETQLPINDTPSLPSKQFQKKPESAPTIAAEQLVSSPRVLRVGASANTFFAHRRKVTTPPDQQPKETNTSTP